MNSVTQSRMGIASGVNNAVARTGGLVAIAVFGVVMLHLFNDRLDHRLALWKVSSSASQSLHAQRTKLAAATIPEDQDPAIQQLMRRAVEESFVSGFRVIMAIGAASAIAGAGVAFAVLPKKIVRRH
jgi:hypothetical protein